MSTSLNPILNGSQTGHRILLSAILLALVVTALGHCSYYVRFIDSTVYLQDMHKLRHGYLAQNWKALTASPAEAPPFVRLTVEGGYPAALAVAQSLNARLPFLLNGFLVPVMLLGFMAVVRKLAATPFGGHCGAVAFLTLALWQFHERSMLWSLTAILRDAPAHALGILGLAWCLPGRAPLPPRRLALVSGGALIGLAAWMRVPDLLFAVPAGLGVLVSGPGLWRQRLARAGLLAAGIALGLLPLNGQNLIEGKNLFQTGQAAALTQPARPPTVGVISAPANGAGLSAAEARAAPTHARFVSRRLHPTFFVHTVPESVRQARRAAAPGIFIVCAAAILLGLRFHPRRTLLLGSGAAAFFVLYGCYYRVIPRYHLPEVLFVLAIAGAELGGLAEQVVRRIPWRRRAVATGLSVALSAAALGLCLARRNPAAARHARDWQDAKRFRAWTAQLSLRADDLICVSDPGARWWFYCFSSVPPTHVEWAWSANDTSVLRQVAAALPAGRRAFFVSLEDEGILRPSWWREDIRNHFAFDDAFPAFRSAHRQRVLRVHRLHQPEARRQTLEVAPGAAGSETLYLLARALPAGKGFQDVQLQGAAGLPAVPARLRTGPNFVRLPPGFLSVTGVTITADAALPGFKSVEPIVGRAATLDFRDFESAPLHARLLGNAKLYWSGWRHWQQDNPAKNAAHFLLIKGTTLHLPAYDRDLTVRLYFAVRGGSPPSAPWRAVDACIAGRQLPATGRFNAGASGAEYWLQEYIVPADTLTPDGNRELELIAEAAAKNSGKIELLRADFIPAPEGAFMRATGSSPAWTLAAQSPAPPDPLHDDTFRFLGGDAEICLSKAEDGPGLLLFMAQPGATNAVFDGRVRVRTTDGVDATLTVDAQGAPTLVAVPLPPGAGSRRILLQPVDIRAAQANPLLLSNLRLLGLTAGIPVPPDIRRGSPLVSGVASPDLDAEGQTYRWTLGRTDCLLPVVGMPSGCRLRAHCGGAPGAVGAVVLSVAVNGIAAGEVTVQPDARQICELPLPARLWREGFNTLTLRSPVWQPSRVLGTADTRSLGIRLYGLTFAPEPTP